MKNTFKWLGIVIVIAAITLFSLATCEDPTQPDATYM